MRSDILDVMTKNYEVLLFKNYRHPPHPNPPPPQKKRDTMMQANTPVKEIDYFYRSL